MFNKKKIVASTIASLKAEAETIAIFEDELDKLRDKIANDTITPDEQRYYDRVNRARAESFLRFVNGVNSLHKTKREQRDFWLKTMANTPTFAE